MKRSISFLRVGWIAGAILCAVAVGGFRTGQAATAHPETGEQPTILSVRLEQTQLVVAVHVPAGLKKLTLESRTRLGAGTWVPRAVERLDGRGGQVTFRLAQSSQLEILRVRADERELLPSSFFSGPSNFRGPVQAGDPKTNPTAGPGGVFDSSTRNDAATPGAAESGRTVVESDIWVIRGNTLCFFNQYRGLQVIDLSVPDAPEVKAELAIPAAGEQMYLLDDRHAVLLARNGCGGDTDGSQILVVDVGSTPLQVVGQVPVVGSIVESRLVGQALYVATQTYRKTLIEPKPGEVAPTEQWEWGLQVTGIDLSEATHPVLRNTLWYPGYGNVITATDRFLFVATQSPENWWQSLIQVVDIARPDGVLAQWSAIRPAGRVGDKFKMNLAPHAAHGDVFTVISETWATTGGQRASVLETFSLGEPARPQSLGRLEVGHGEGLYATRFDGTRAYLVTFLRIDPLWVVDLADPTKPRLFGELQVPGWSTYIHPLGDRLVTIGIDNSNSWRVAVSLFDVRDPAKPTLLAKVPIGEQSSWSEANWDEKAFTVLPEADLILVPYQGWSDKGYASRVQLIDLGAETLQARGVIEHRLQPRRATVHGERVVSISGRELLIVNAKDRDHPAVTAERELSWGVNRVLLAGDYLLELTDGQTWGDATPPSVRVATRNQPGRTLGHLALDASMPLLGATVQAGQLLVLQGVPGVSGIVPTPDDPKGGSPANPPAPPPNLRLSLIDLSTLPALKVLATTDAVVDDLGWGADFKPLWLEPELLVWAANSGGVPWMWWGGPRLDVGMPVGGRFMGDMLWWPWWGGGGGRLLAFDLKPNAAPKLVSDVNLAKDQLWWSASSASAAGRAVYLSHQQTVYVPLGELSGSGGKPDGPGVTPPDGRWETRYYLEVVDFADPANPTVRPPTNLPGQLLGLALNGALLYTQGYRYDAQGGSDGAEYLDALGYDGVKASLVTSLKLPQDWPRAVVVHEGAAFLARPNATAPGGSLESWSVPIEGSQAGQFVRNAQAALASPAYALAGFGKLLAAAGSLRVDLFDFSDATILKPIGAGMLGTCGGFDLGHGDGALDLGLWIPLQDYGVLGVPVNAKP